MSDNILRFITVNEVNQIDQVREYAKNINKK